MRKSLLVLLASLVMSVAAFGQSTTKDCNPLPYGSAATSTGYFVGSTAEGEYAVWFCKTKYAWKANYAYKLNSYRVVHPDVKGLTIAQYFQKYWDANVTWSANGPAPQYAGLYAAAKADPRWAATKPEDPLWVVARNGTSTTRPAFALALPDGAARRKTATGTIWPSVGTAPVGNHCIMTDPKFVSEEGTSTYGRFISGGTVADTQVTLCRPETTP